MSRSFEVNVPNRVVLLGRGLTRDAEGTIIPTRQTVVRAESVGMFVRRHPREFASSEAKIVCSGGHPSDWQGDIAPGVSEGRFSADILVRDFGIPAKIVEIEGNSDNTIANMAETARGQYFGDTHFDRVNPLGVGANSVQWVRAHAAGEIAFDIAPDAMVRLPGAQEYNPLRLVHEVVADLATVHFIRGVQPGDLDELSRRAQQVTEFGDQPITSQAVAMAKWALGAA